MDAKTPGPGPAADDHVDTALLGGQLLGSAKTDEWYAGLVKDVGNPMSIGEYTDLDREALLGLQTQAILMSGFGEGFDDVSNARSAGLPGVSVSNRMEEHALASAEWIKMIAAFYNAEDGANAEFGTTKSKFDKVVSTVSGKVDGRDAGYLCVSAERGCEFIYGHGKDTLVGRLLPAARAFRASPTVERERQHGSLIVRDEAGLSRTQRDENGVKCPILRRSRRSER
ncbi:ABC transporter substrate-binding protein [Streptomyces sp. NPDC050509]|uniref:ABC transporter substrate-binding protein n=1 Tax=Streptomyces sp. NPDC050509 TaxID=3365620 RepID=UPI0037A96957